MALAVESCIKYVSFVVGSCIKYVSFAVEIKVVVSTMTLRTSSWLAKNIEVLDSPYHSYMFDMPYLA